MSQGNYLNLKRYSPKGRKPKLEIPKLTGVVKQISRGN